MAEYYDVPVFEGKELFAVGNELPPDSTGKPGPRKAALVEYVHSIERPLYLRDQPNASPEDSIRGYMERYSDKEIEDAVEKNRETPQLFYHQPAMITMAFAHPTMRAHIPTLLGIALNRLGPSTVPDESLSEHSRPLAQRLLAMGVIQPNPNNRDALTNNDVDFGSVNEHFTSYDARGATSIDSVEVQGGRAKIREVLGRNRHLSSQFTPVTGEQLQVPGLEG